MIYQAHIDGLRAVAVASVILFHLDLRWFEGGFVGVDVFFVISGFLITSIIVKEVQSTGDFSFKKFYTRRARRLLPALFSVFAICIVVALFLYSSERLYDFGVELIFSVVSAANFLFWFQSGYFDANSDAKLLLHMWSLSVEEQFYIFWPLFLVLFYKYLSNKTIFILGVIGFLISLMSNIILTNFEVGVIKNQTEMMFYLMPFRVYEFLIGAFGVWAFNRVPNNKLFQEVMFIVGITAIIISVMHFKTDMKFPYYTALLPCIGALLVILSKSSVIGRVLLENKLLVFIGLISYTLYLVHWPVIVFYKYFRLIELTPFDKAIAVIITISVSLFIYYLIEKPLRKPRTIQICNQNLSPNKSFLKCCLVASLVFMIFGSVLATTSGLSEYKNELISEEELVAGKNRRYDLIRKGCLLAELDSDNCMNNRPMQVLVLGDSHEPDGYNIFHTMFGNDPNVNLIRFGGTNFCKVDPLINDKITSPIKKRSCNERVNKLNEPNFVNSLDVVVYSSNRPFAANELSAWRMLAHISSVNKRTKFIVIGTYFNTKVYCSEIANRFNDLKQCKNHNFLSYVGNNELDNIYNPEIVNDIDFIYLDKFAALCDTVRLDSCPVSANDEPMFYDQHHSSLGFARFVGSQYLVMYKNELQEAGFQPISLKNN